MAPRDFFGDLVLKDEDVPEVAVVSFGPQRYARFSVDQLHRDTDVGTAAPHAAAEDVPNAQAVARPVLFRWPCP